MSDGAVAESSGDLHRAAMFSIGFGAIAALADSVVVVIGNWLLILRLVPVGDLSAQPS